MDGKEKQVCCFGEKVKMKGPNAQEKVGYRNKHKKTRIFSHVITNQLTLKKNINVNHFMHFIFLKLYIFYFKRMS